MCRIGEKVTFGHGAIIHAALVSDKVVIGMGAVISIRSEIGEGTIVAEGAVVRMKQVVPGGIVVGGNPAKMVRNLSSKDIEFWTRAKNLYIELAKKYIEQGIEHMAP